MWTWYRNQLRQFGFLTATVLLFRVARSRIVVDLSNRLLPALVSCPCCGWSGRKYYDYIEAGYTVPNAACPQCDSHPRHRKFFLWLQSEYKLGEKIGVAMVFAPERALDSIWEGAKALRVFRADFETTRRVDLQLDLQQLPLTSNAVDLVWCHHLLEHVKDDLAAMRELSRIMRPGTGELVVSVPMLNAPKTIEYGFADPKESGHWRIYGDDFVDRLEAAGFAVKEVDFKLPGQVAASYGIVDEPFYICRKPAGPQAQT